MKTLIYILIFSFPFLSIASDEFYTCEISGEYLQLEFNDTKSYELTVGGQAVDLVSQRGEKVIGSLRLQRFGDSLKLIFRPRGSGAYVSGSGPIGTMAIGFSHGLLLEGSVGHTNFFANCELRWKWKV